MSDNTIYLVEVTAYDPSLPGTTTLRWSTGLGKMTSPSESPANAHYSARVAQPMDFTRAMFSNVRVTGGSKVGTGELVLRNTDQGLASLRDYGIDGRAVVIRIGPQDAAYPAGYTTFLTGTAEQVEVGARTATIRLRDKLAVLQQPLQATLYAGTNVLPAGAEGTADDIKGQPKPMLFGRRYQIAPVLVNTSKLTYQFHDGTAQAVDAVYDQGVALVFAADRADLAALEAAVVAAGQYDTCLALGLVRLGAAATGRVTMDARGDASGGYVNTAGAIVQRILTQRCGISVGDIDTGSVTALDAAAPGECGEYFTSETRQAAVDAILASVGGWLAPSRAGVWQVGRLMAPSGTPAFSFTDSHILQLDSVATRDDGAGIPVWRVKLRHKRYVQIGRADLAGAVTEARKAELQQEWRETTASDSAVQTTYLLAPEMSRDTCLQQAADAATEASRLLTLHKVRRDYVRAVIWLTQTSAAIDLGSVVRLTTSRLGYGSGRDFIVVAITADGRRGRITLDLWG
jgi:hypothetical protein